MAVRVQQTVVMSRLTALTISLRVRNSLASRETVRFSNETFTFRVGTNYKLNLANTLLSAKHGAVCRGSTVLLKMALDLNFFCGVAALREPGPSHFFRFLDHTQRGFTVGMTPLDE